MRDLAALRERFSLMPAFAAGSPLYRALGEAVAQDEPMLRLASRSGSEHVVPLFFAGVHYLLLGGADHELSQYYPTVVGDKALPPDDVGPVLASFCARYEPEMTTILETRLVQTNAVKRSLLLRLGLVEVARHVETPVHLVEIGASAGANLRVDRYGFNLGGRQYGDPRSHVQIQAECVGHVPDLDAIPQLSSATGIDLHPLDATDPDDRLWLRALCWPDDPYGQVELLDAALDIVAEAPPVIHEGDIADVCPGLAAELPPGETRVSFEVGVRVHVPGAALEAFDQAITTLGDGAPQYHISLDTEGWSRADRTTVDQGSNGAEPSGAGGTLTVRDPSNRIARLALVDRHIQRVEPLDGWGH